MTNQARQLIKLAESYCEQIESMDSIDQGRFALLLKMLNQLQESIGVFDKPDPLTQEIAAVDLDARFELFSHLFELLGQQDAYAMEHDGISHDPILTGSLADDLTDIYCELKHGLKLLDEKPERAINCWLHGYYLHWQEHLVDAQRHLRSLE